MHALRTCDWYKIIEDLLASGMTLSQVAEANDMVSMSKSLLRYYKDGGQPTFPRGYALLGLWCERTGKTEEFAPLVDWWPTQRAESMTLRKRCPTCGQTMRDNILARWHQMELHKQQHGGLEDWPRKCAEAQKPGPKPRARVAA